MPILDPKKRKNPPKNTDSTAATSNQNKRAKRVSNGSKGKGKATSKAKNNNKVNGKDKTTTDGEGDGQDVEQVVDGDANGDANHVYGFKPVLQLMQDPRHKDLVKNPRQIADRVPSSKHHLGIMRLL
ncbi:hypothetical protein MAJ_08838, partial [Metarhizium majus ARSEF 297]